ncbi:MAG: hypothetical protein ACREQW_08935 [Candidatus Binatia bacterium]
MVYEPIFRTQLVFQEDVLAAARYFATIRNNRLSPEEKLMLAVLQNALECFQTYVEGRTVRARNLFAEAEGWLMKDSAKDRFFSFENACETLRLNPDYVRKRLRDWKSKRCKSRPKMRAVKQSMAA